MESENIVVDGVLVAWLSEKLTLSEKLIVAKALVLAGMPWLVVSVVLADPPRVVFRYGCGSIVNFGLEVEGSETDAVDECDRAAELSEACAALWVAGAVVEMLDDVVRPDNEATLVPGIPYDVKSCGELDVPLPLCEM